MVGIHPLNKILFKQFVPKGSVDVIRLTIYYGLSCLVFYSFCE